ncbi:uncharacterized protein LOC135108592 [Scylla paramamosain]|uniref:uncharacterized protein LOC135108592 n=1 Tax=Scylla paramamosain TaxID=85552 RepID=UPI003083D8CD
MFQSWKYGGAHFEAETTTGYGNFTHQLISQMDMVDRARQLRLQSWCVTVVVVSNDPAFLIAFAKESDNGRLVVWDTRLLVITRLAIPIIQALLQDFWIFSMMSTMFLKIRNTSRWQVFVHLPYSPSGPQVVPVATWNPGRRFVYFEERVPFPDKYNNFYGTPINLTWLPLKPYWTETKQQGPDGKEILTYQGREYLITLAMGAALNFSLRPLPYEGWDSVLGRLRTREAFMWPVNFPILPHMVKEYDFSFFLERSTLAFTMAKPSIKPSWQSLYYPLQIDVWIYILVTTLIVLIVLIVMNRSSKDDGTSAWLVMKQVLGTLLDEAIPGELPLKDSTRVALTAWLIFSFIVGTVYRSNLTACLTVPKYPPRLENLAQLADSGAKQASLFFINYFSFIYLYLL